MPSCLFASSCSPSSSAFLYVPHVITRLVHVLIQLHNLSLVLLLGPSECWIFFDTPRDSFLPIPSLSCAGAGSSSPRSASLLRWPRLVCGLFQQLARGGMVILECSTLLPHILSSGSRLTVFALITPPSVPMIDSSLFILSPNHIPSWNFASTSGPLLLACFL